jgi:uncharacterized protein YbbC (DUF1343 family)
MTLCELAQLFNEEYKINCDLYILPMENWRRRRYFDQTGLLWVNPSPNMPSVDTALLYPGTCLLEGTNVSEGRGTTKPFEIFGTPWLDAEKITKYLNNKNLPGLGFRAMYFKPVFSKYAGELCRGVQVHITDRDIIKPLEAGLVILESIKEHHEKEFEWLAFIDSLDGCGLLQQENGFDLFKDECIKGTKDFLPVRKKYLLYEE